RLSRGAFVKLLHADDLLLPDCVEAMVGLALEDDGIALVFAPREVLLEDGSDPEWAERFARPHERFTRLERINEGRDVFRQLLEGLLTIPNLRPEECRELGRLRRAALRRALRAQAGRLVQRRWTPELPSYLAYRTRSGMGARPRLHDALGEPGAAEAQLSARG